MKTIKNKLLTHYVNDLHILGTKFRSNTSLAIQESWEQKPSDITSVSFQNWFDSTQSLEQTEQQAQMDFDHRIIKNIDVARGVACEIGFGGGRLLANAARAFNNVYGIDVHDQFAKTESYLKSKGLDNFNLVRFEDRDSIPAVDLFYSFIVIQHFQSISILEDYIELIHGKLSPNGMAVLWYGKLSTPFWGRYYEVPPSKFRIRECTLFITPRYMEKLCAKFNVLEHSTRNPKNLLTGNGLSMQAKIVIQKN